MDATLLYAVKTVSALSGLYPILIGGAALAYIGFLVTIIRDSIVSTRLLRAETSIANAAAEESDAYVSAALTAYDGLSSSPALEDAPGYYSSKISL